VEVNNVLPHPHPYQLSGEVTASVFISFRALAELTRREPGMRQHCMREGAIRSMARVI
jgi:hypothetical protein